MDSDTVIVAETGIETLKKKEVIMPGGDKTGPIGAGPMTGRRLGFCVGNTEPGAFYGRGYGMGRGPGMGFRHGMRGGFGRRFAWQSEPVPSYENEMMNDRTFLEREIGGLKDQLSFLENKLSKLDDK
ncbi:MAG TPA: DUF5320 domain-containing protein [Bacteroidales bacterium]|nr:DUF5320 domain-containing protein [Bacteroidales bacterium]